jgi:hypothetical protein
MNSFFDNKFKILSLALFAQAGLDPQFRREYAGNVTSETLANNPSFSDLIDYRAVPQSSQPIEGGWQAPRYSFVMHVQYLGFIGQQAFLDIAGYTTKLEASDKIEGSDMRYVINTISMSRRIFMKTPEGPLVHDELVMCDHIYANPDFRGIYAKEQLYKLRPEDIYAAMKLSSLAPVLEALDMRTILDVKPVAARRSLMIPALYLDTIITNYRKARGASGLLGAWHEEDILECARGYAQETYLRANPFFKALDVISDGSATNSFTWSDLVKMSPKISSVTIVIPDIHPRAQYASWENSDLSTHLAWHAAMGVPALMGMLGLPHTTFSVTNNISLQERAENPLKKSSFIMTDVNSSEVNSSELDVDSSPAIEAFQRSFERYLQPKLSMNDLLSFKLQVDSNMYGDTIVELALNGAAPVRYLVPTFADSLLSPLVGPDDNRFLISDIEQIIHFTDESALSALGQAPL